MNYHGDKQFNVKSMLLNRYSKAVCVENKYKEQRNDKEIKKEA